MKNILTIVITIAFILILFNGCEKGGVNITGNELIKDGTVEQITVSSSPEGYNYSFSHHNDIRAIVDYLSNLNISSSFQENPSEYDGMTWSINIKYIDGSESIVYHFGNKFIRNENGSWYRMQYEEASRFDSLLSELK